jgi:hypothetical protein
MVRTIDLRLFAALKCNMNFKKAVFPCLWCSRLISRIRRSRSLSASRRKLSRCSALLGVKSNGSAPSDTEAVYHVHHTCIDTVWTASDAVSGPEPRNCGGQSPVPSFYHDSLLFRISIGKLQPLTPRPVLSILGKGEAAKAKVLSWGSTFNYFDLHPAEHTVEISASSSNKSLGYTF